jgi:hypothetical protein
MKRRRRKKNSQGSDTEDGQRTTEKEEASLKTLTNKLTRSFS